jgi:hypothetical protein
MNSPRNQARWIAAIGATAFTLLTFGCQLILADHYGQTANLAGTADDRSIGSPASFRQADNSPANLVQLNQPQPKRADPARPRS